MQINEVTTLLVEDGVGIITVDSPPVNALSNVVRQGLLKALVAAEQDTSIVAIVVTCAGRTFFPGADIAEFGAQLEPTLPALLQRVDGLSKPVIAAMHGTAFGGGLELALATHFRVATPSARFGLPEVKLGILPGAGGTQRLPRAIGIPKALAMILSGEPIDAATALETGLIDTVAAGDVRDAACLFAQDVVADGRLLRRLRDRTDLLDQSFGQPELFENSRERKYASKSYGPRAAGGIVRSVCGALSLPFEQGLAQERAIFDELIGSDESRALRYLFFAERRAVKIDELRAGVKPRSVAKVGVIGAGTMGGGIAMNFLSAGLPVAITEADEAALAAGIAKIRRNYETSAAKGRITHADVEARMKLLTGSTTIQDVADCDVIIEAVFEDLNIKREVFADLDRIAKPAAILATNTSYLDVDAIAAATLRPASVIGLHFFSPANIMKLMEIVRGRDTAPDVIATAADIARTIGKTGVVVGNGFGFVGNRILAARNAQADMLILEGAAIEDVDAVLRAFGFPMGHFEMRDLVGLDVGWNKANSSSSTVRESLNEMGRHGQKSGGGYYDYDPAQPPHVSPTVNRLIADFASRSGVARRDVAEEEIRDRLLYAMVNEGARTLGEGVAQRASDIDVIWTTGYGWPRYRGGPMFWADQQGMPAVLAKLERLSQEHGEQFTPSLLIQRLASESGSFTESKART